MPKFFTKRGGLPAAPANGLAEGGSIQIFAQVHQSEERVQYARLHFIREVQAAGGRSRQHFALLGDVTDDFDLARVRGFSVHRFAAHLGAFGFDPQRKMEHAQMNRFERRRYLSFATVFAASR
jgi:hypothetical protein